MVESLPKNYAVNCASVLFRQNLLIPTKFLRKNAVSYKNSTILHKKVENLPFLVPGPSGCDLAYFP